MSEKPRSLFQLDTNEIKVVLALQSDPMASYGKLAKHTGFSKPGVYKIIKRLRTRPDIYFFKVTGRYNEKRLGLEHLDVLVSAETRSMRAAMKRVIKIHPYLNVSARCNGYYNGWLFQFKIPQGKINLIELFFEKLKNNQFLDTYTILRYETPTIFTEQQNRFWDEETLSWQFDFGDWFLKEIKPSLHPVPQNERNVKNWLEKTDISILGEIILDARRDYESIIDHLQNHRTPSVEITLEEFRARYLKLKKYCTSGYRIFFSSNSFDVCTPYVLWGIGDPEKLNNLRSRMEQFPIPFNSNLKIDGSTFFWYINVPSHLYSQLSFYLEDIIENIHQVTLEMSRTNEWLLDPENWDEDAKDWIQTEDYIVNYTIDKLKSQEEKEGV